MPVQSVSKNNFFSPNFLDFVYLNPVCVVSLLEQQVAYVAVDMLFILGFQWAQDDDR